jgi:hypothetical protein
MLLSRAPCCRGPCPALLRRLLRLLCSAQLASRVREDPGVLRALPSFCVVRRGVGSVRWLDPVDVEGVDLDACVSLGRGCVEVYLSEAAEKPEVGQGLNKPAEVRSP